MATRIIASGDARPIPPTEDSKTRSRLLAEIDNELEIALVLSSLAEWIESARYYRDTVRSEIERRSELQALFLESDFRWNAASWEDVENTGLAFLQQAISGHMRKAREVAAEVQR